uniref:Uncharacterized protein n=1 Tax=Romanomermis culicivorax TaxID=13658 RepID=A0A915ITY8_ROMCU
MDKKSWGHGIDYFKANEDTGSAIIRQFFKPALLGILSPRDSIDVFQFFKTDSYQYSCFSSVKYPALSPDPNYVRSYAFPMGIAAVPTS